jgi:hypothetical protein
MATRILKRNFVAIYFCNRVALLPQMKNPRRPFLALSAPARLRRVLPALVVLWLAVAWALGDAPW